MVLTSSPKKQITVYDRLLNPGRYKRTTTVPIQTVISVGRNSAVVDSPLRATGSRSVTVDSRLRAAEDRSVAVDTPPTATGSRSLAPNRRRQEPEPKRIRHLYYNSHFPWSGGVKAQIPARLPYINEGYDDPYLYLSFLHPELRFDFNYNTHFRVSDYVEVRMLDIRSMTWGPWEQAVVIGKPVQCAYETINHPLVAYQVQIVDKTLKNEPMFCSVFSFAGEIRSNSYYTPSEKYEFDFRARAAFKILNSLHTVFVRLPLVPTDADCRKLTNTYVPARIVRRMFQGEHAVICRKTKRDPNDHDRFITIVYHPAFTPATPPSSIWHLISRRTINVSATICPWPASAHPAGFCTGTCVQDDVQYVAPYTRTSVELLQHKRCTVHLIPTKDSRH